MFVGLSLGASACLEKCAPGQVGPGVARLTARNLGAIIQAVNDDANCGFESQTAKDALVMDAEPGQLGNATVSIEKCELNFDEQTAISYDCNQVATRVTGRIVVSARRTISGTLTGDPDQPAVPLSPDAVTIELLDIEFDDFKVETSASSQMMIQRSGHLSAIAKPRLAVESEQGVCSVATPNIEMSQIKYRDAVVHVIANGRSFETPVPTSDFTAINGVHGDHENELMGTVKVWGANVDLPGSSPGLDPDYNAAKFIEGFACTDKLQVPVSHECGGLGPILADNGARLTIRNMGTINRLIEKDETCGFTSVPVLQTPVLSAPVGEAGEAIFRVDNCTIDLGDDYLVATDCMGNETRASGKVTITAQKTMRGRLTGDLYEPVVPNDDHPVTFVIERAAFDNFSVTDAQATFTQIDGAVSGEVTPRIAMNAEQGACSIDTPIARMENVSYDAPTKVVIKADQGTFHATISSANVRAVNGTWGEESNVLQGSFGVAEEVYELPAVAGDEGLDPSFSAASFDDAWLCKENLDTQNPFVCRFGAPLAQGAAQLGVLTLGTIANFIEEDETCGFLSDGVLDTVVTDGALGDPGGEVTFNLSTPCVHTLTEPTVLREDCNGKKTYGEGTFRVIGSKTLQGYVSGDRLQPVVPTTMDPAEIAIGIQFENFKIWTEPGDNSLAVHSGELTGTLRPRTALDTGLGACSIPTGVALFEKVSWKNADVTVVSGGRTFNSEIATSNLTAVNGKRDDVENDLLGNIDLDGETYRIPALEGQGLDPDYDAQKFVDGFMCEENIQVPVDDSECDMTKPLGEGAARLLIMSLGNVTGIANDDDFGCAFGARGTLTDPIRVTGDPGDMGEMEWRIDGCKLSYDQSDGPYQRDCLDRGNHMYGEARVTGNRVVEGIRDEISILFISIDSIIPNHRRAVTITWDDIEFTNFQAFDLDPGASTPNRGITIKEGRMTAVVEPITGENDGSGGGIPAPTAGAFDVPTRIARMRNVESGPMDVTILYEGKTFNVHLDYSTLYAFNGSWRDANETNVISGEISINGKVISMEPSQDLDPDFEQVDFDERYVCTDSLVGLIPPAP